MSAGSGRAARSSISSNAVSSGSTVGLVFDPVCELSHPGMVSERLHRVVATLEVCVADGEVYVAVAGSAQGDSPGRIAPPEFLPTLPPALHLPGAGARQEVVPGKTVLPDASATELAHPFDTRLEVFSAFHCLQIIRAAYADDTVGATRINRSGRGQRRHAAERQACLREPDGPRV